MPNLKKIQNKPSLKKETPKHKHPKQTGLYGVPVPALENDWMLLFYFLVLDEVPIQSSIQSLWKACLYKYSSKKNLENQSQQTAALSISLYKTSLDFQEKCKLSLLVKNL